MSSESICYRFAAARPGGAVWLFKRNCALRPRQLLAMFGLLCCISGGVAVFFVLQGILWVLPFTAFELLAVAVAFGMYGRHACDNERLSLEGDTLTFCHESAGKTDLIEFRREWVQVRVMPGNPSMLELSEGRKKAFFGRFLRVDLHGELLREIHMALRKSDTGKATLG